MKKAFVTLLFFLSTTAMAQSLSATHANYFATAPLSEKMDILKAIATSRDLTDTFVDQTEMSWSDRLLTDLDAIFLGDTKNGSNGRSSHVQSFVCTHSQTAEELDCELKIATVIRTKSDPVDEKINYSITADLWLVGGSWQVRSAKAQPTPRA